MHRFFSALLKEWLTVDFIIEARLVNAAVDGFSKSIVNVSPADLKVSSFIVTASVVVIVVAAVEVVFEGVVVEIIVVVVVFAAPGITAVVFKVGAAVVEFDIFISVKKERKNKLW